MTKSSKSNAAVPGKSKLKRLGILVAVAALLYTLVGFLVVPYVVRTQVPKQTLKLLGTEARIAEVKVNPYTFEATLGGFELDDPDGGRLAGFDRVYANLRFLSLLTGKIEATQILVERPTVNAVLDEDGSLNLLKIVPEAEEKPDEEPGRLPTVIVRDFRVIGASVTAEDKARGFSTMVSSLNLSVTNLSTISNQVARIEINAETGFGENFTLGADASVVPVDVKGTVKLSGVNVENYLAFVRPLFKGDLSNGSFDFSVEFAASVNGGEVTASVEGGSVAVGEIAIREEHGAQPLVELSSFSIEEISAEYPALSIEIGSIGLADGGARVVLDEDKQLNLLGLVDLGASEEEEPAAEPAEPGEPLPLSVRLGEFVISGFRIDAEDRSLPKPAKIPVTLNRVSLASAAYPVENPVQLGVDVGVGEGGTVKIDGPVDVAALKTRLNFNIENIALALGEPYVAPIINLVVGNGTLDTKGTVEVAMREDNPLPSVHLASDLLLSGVYIETVDPPGPIVDVESVDVRGIDADLDPMRIVIEEIHHTKGKKYFVIDKNGRMNIVGLVKESEETGEAPQPDAAAPAPPELPPVQVKRIIVNDAELSLTDELFDPPFEMTIKNVDGEIENVNTDPDEQIALSLKGLVGDAGRFEIDGTALPLNENRQADVKVSMNGFALRPTSAVSGKFIGYPVDRGSLNLAVRYQIADQNLEGDNKITVRNLELGNRIAGSDAPNLPIKLAIKLLKDSNGEINLDVPIDGRIDDPSFQLSAVIADSFAGIITKVATSPFTLLGSLVGGGDDDLSRIEFEAGSAELSAKAEKALDKLAKALAKRPVLQLDVPTVLPGAEDLALLREAAFDAAIDEKLASIPEAAALPAEQRIARAYAMEFDLPTAAVTNPAALDAAGSGEVVAEVEEPTDTDADGGVSTRPKTWMGRFWYEDVLGWRFEEPLKDEPSSVDRLQLPDTTETGTGDVTTVVDEAGPSQPLPPLNEMKTALMEKVEVPEEALNTLASERAAAIRGYLLEQGVEENRVIVTAPKEDVASGRVIELGVQ